MNRSVVSLAAAALAAAASTVSAQTFTFDGPAWTPSMTLPAVGVAPEAPGSSPITANFSAPLGTVVVGYAPPGQVPDISGNYLSLFTSEQGPAAVLVALSAPVTSLSFNFRLLVTEPGANMIVALDPDLGSPTLPPLHVFAATDLDADGPTFWGGIVSINSPTPFTSFVLFGNLGVPADVTGLSPLPALIDNLSVPTPGAAALLGLGALASARRRR